MSSQPDRRARFESLADVVFDSLQRYLHRRLDPEDASDAFAETLLVIWRRIDEVPAGDVLPWCYAVARRVVANQRRGNERRLRLVQRLSFEPPPPPVTVGSHGDPELEAALDQLGEMDREILRLWAWEGLEPREIAPVLGLTVNAATLRLSRAKKKLAVELGAMRQDQDAIGHRTDDTPRSKR